MKEHEFRHILFEPILLKIAFKIAVLLFFKYICLDIAGWGKQRNT